MKDSLPFRWASQPPRCIRLERTQLPDEGIGPVAVGSMAEPTPPTLPSELPVLPLRRTVAFPLTLQPLAVNRPVSIESVNRALQSDRLVLLVLQHSDADDPHPEDVHRVGTVGIVRQMAKVGGGINIIVEGVARVRADVVTRTGTSMPRRLRSRHVYCSTVSIPAFC